jgi:uncharacterized coiled-coil DUF342 family protein
VTARPVLSEEAEREDEAERAELFRLEGKIRELRERRQRLVDDARKLSDEQRALYDARQPRQDRLEAAHRDHVELGHRLGELRRARDDARRASDQALVALREFRARLPQGEVPRPDAIRREIRDLEMRQQTHALPRPEENALVDRVRLLSRQLGEAEKGAAAADERSLKLRELEEALRIRRAEAERLAMDLPRVHAERDSKMRSMKEQLVEVGRLVAELREKGQQRAAAMERLDVSFRELSQMEREAERLFQRSRDRRQEAKSAVRDYNRSVRETVAGEGAYARHADAQLEELLKRGKITLGR